MKKTVRNLIVSSLVLLAAGSVLYYLGSQQNLIQVPGDEIESLWTQSRGDKLLYAGGLMILLAGSLGVAGIKVWLHNRRRSGAYSLTPASLSSDRS